MATDFNIMTGPIKAWAEDGSNPNNTVSLTSGRYYPERLPHDPVFPCVVLTEVGASPDVMSHDVTRVMTAVRVQFDVYADTKEEAGQIGKLLFASFQGMKNTTIGSGLGDGGVFVLSCFRQFRQYIAEDDLDRWRFLQDFIFNV